MSYGIDSYITKDEWGRGFGFGWFGLGVLFILVHVMQVCGGFGMVIFGITQNLISSSGFGEKKGQFFAH